MIALGKHFEEVLEGRVFVVGPPDRRKADAAWPRPVAQLPIDQTGKVGANIGFQYKTDANFSGLVYRELRQRTTCGNKGA